MITGIGWMFIIWCFACVNHFAHVWDAWGGSEARILKKAEVKGDETFRTVVDIVIYLRRYRKEMKSYNNQNVNADETTETG